MTVDLQMILGYILVAFTMYRTISFYRQQRAHARTRQGETVTMKDVVSSRAIDVLYLTLYIAAGYGIFVLHTAPVFLGLALACMIGAWLLRQAALRAIGRNYGHEIVIFDDHTLVQSGIYAYIRHPLYLGLSLDTFGALLASYSIFGLVAWVLFIIVVVRRVSIEDKELLHAFGQEAVEYQKQVPAIIPFTRG